MGSAKDFIDSKVELLTGDVSKFDVDYDLLSKYLNLRLTIRDREKGQKEKFYKLPFRKCKIEDFSGRGLNIDETLRSNFLTRLCP